MTRMGDLLGPDPVLLPGDSAAEAELEAGEKPAIVAAAHPTASVAWAALAERGAGRRQGHHRVRLRQHRLPPRSGPVAAQRLEGIRPGALRARAEPGLPALRGRSAKAADAIGESDEYARCLDLLDDCDPAARGELGL